MRYGFCLPEDAKGAEFISLEDADAEAQGRRTRATAEDREAPEDAETEETVEDDAETPFIEVEEEEDTDVSEIIGGDVEETKRRPE